MSTSPVSQMVLPGQAAAPPGPVDLVAMYVLHHAFRRDLGDFTAAVCGTPVEDRATWVALADRWRRLSDVLHKHHSGRLSPVVPADDPARRRWTASTVASKRAASTASRGSRSA